MDFGNDSAFVHHLDWDGWMLWTFEDKTRMDKCSEAKRSSSQACKAFTHLFLNTINQFIFYSYPNELIIIIKSWLGCIINIAFFGKFCLIKTCFYKRYYNFCIKLRAQNHRHKKNSQIAMWIFKRKFFLIILPVALFSAFVKAFKGLVIFGSQTVFPTH